MILLKLWPKFNRFWPNLHQFGVKELRTSQFWYFSGVTSTITCVQKFPRDLTGFVIIRSKSSCFHSGIKLILNQTIFNSVGYSFGAIRDIKFGQNGANVVTSSR